MSSDTKTIAILGSTGSIGQSTLDVIARCDGSFRAMALSAHARLGPLMEQAKQVGPKWIVATDEQEAARFDWSELPAETELVIGQDGLQRVASDEAIDVVVAAIVGSAGLQSTWAAIEAGKTIALANKETLVVAGELAMRRASECGATVLPVDSEHSAVFQALRAGNHDEVARIILTASGGPFRRHTLGQLQHVTVDEALAHPTWDMGPKITVDSATMMNKALEIIEARWLFGVDPDRIDVVIHPQSIVHSMVEFTDGSVLAQLSPPDMRLPIQYALTYPERLPGPAKKLDLTEMMNLQFEPPDPDRFPALELGHEVAKAGGTAGAVFNAANGAAVAGFLEGRLSFVEIVPACRDILESHHFDPNPTLDELLRLDAWAREEISKWVCT